MKTHGFSPDASFSESLYGLRRRVVDIKIRKDGAKVDSKQLQIPGLRRRQKVLSVAFVVDTCPSTLSLIFLLNFLSNEIVGYGS